MAKVYFVREEISIEIPVGTSVLEAEIQAGLAPDVPCGAKPPPPLPKTFVKVDAGPGGLSSGPYRCVPRCFTKRTPSLLSLKAHLHLLPHGDFAVIVDGSELHNMIAHRSGKLCGN